MDETHIKVNGQWKYLYRALDKEGATIDFLLRARRDTAAATRFFEKAMRQKRRSREGHDGQEWRQQSGHGRD